MISSLPARSSLVFKKVDLIGEVATDSTTPYAVQVSFPAVEEMVKGVAGWAI